MNFDIKDVKSWANRHDVKVGDKGYFGRVIGDFIDANLYRDKISQIDDNDGYPFTSQQKRYTWAFFLPLSAVKEDKPKEKKYRPLICIDEIENLLGHSILERNFLTYRNKISGNIYIELLYAVCRDKNDVLRAINNISVQKLFSDFEIRKNGKWLPFGVEVKDE